MEKELTLKQRIITLLLTILFVGYVGNVSFFTHEHKVGDGIIVHSHPYSSSSHGHSATAFTSLSVISHFDTLQQYVNKTLVVDMQLLGVVECVVEIFIQSISLQGTSLRGPPVL